MLVERYGAVEKMRLKLAAGSDSYDCYIVFKSSSSASAACNSLHGHCVNDITVKCKLFNIKNFIDDPYDFVPKDLDKSLGPDKSPRNSPTLTWHVATYREGKENLIKASENIQARVGKIPYENLKRYGKNILIKAGNTTQAVLLKNFKPNQDSVIKNISPHKSFNTTKGVIFSKELFEFSEEDILERCPPNVYQVRKLRGANNTILLTFSSAFIPDAITIGHSRIRIKKFIQKPTQCHNCFEFGHVISYCPNEKKCYTCSAEHEVLGSCSAPRFCYHCKGDHSPNSKLCPRYNFEVDILECANTEHIAIGSAKRKLMGANKSPQSTYASVIKNLKVPFKGRRGNANQASPAAQPHLSKEPSSTVISGKGPKLNKKNSKRPE